MDFPQVVNVKKAKTPNPLNPHVNNANIQDWMASPPHLYIGRTMRINISGRDRITVPGSEWRNPYRGSTAVNQFTGYIIDKINTGEVRIEDLEGKILGCWCHPERCHGHVLWRIYAQVRLRGRVHPIFLHPGRHGRPEPGRHGRPEPERHGQPELEVKTPLDNLMRYYDYPEAIHPGEYIALQFRSEYVLKMEKGGDLTWYRVPVKT